MLIDHLVKPLVAKVMAGALAGSLILSGVLGVSLYLRGLELESAKEVIQDLADWQGDMVQAIRLASGSPETTEKTARAQVQAMGQSLLVLNGALTTANNAVDRLADEKAKAEAIAEREMRARAAAMATAERLLKELQARGQVPVAAEDMEAEVRRAQDAAYEAGL